MRAHHLLLGLLMFALVGGVSRVQGQSVDLQSATASEILDTVAQNDAQVTVVNMWATWCVPCIEEFPHFMKFGEEFADQGVEVVFVSTDVPSEKDAARDFLVEQGVTGLSFLKAGKTTPFVNTFHEAWTGAVPATFLYNADGQLLEFWEGKMSYDALERKVMAYF